MALLQGSSVNDGPSERGLALQPLAQPAFRGFTEQEEADGGPGTFVLVAALGKGTMHVRLSKEFVEHLLAKGVSPSKASEALGLLAELESASAGSRLTLEDAVELGREASRRAWERLREA